MRGPLGFAQRGYIPASLGMTPIQFRLARFGVSHLNPAPPRPAPSVTLTVRDAYGFGAGSCFDKYESKSQLYVLYALQRLDCRVWLSASEIGSVVFVEDGELADAFVVAGPRIGHGEEITFTATGPDAEEALEVSRQMLEAHPMDRKEIYRRWRHRGEGVS